MALRPPREGEVMPLVGFWQTRTDRIAVAVVALVRAESPPPLPEHERAGTAARRWHLCAEELAALQVVPGGLRLGVGLEPEHHGAALRIKVAPQGVAKERVNAALPFDGLSAPARHEAEVPRSRNWLRAAFGERRARRAVERCGKQQLRGAERVFGGMRCSRFHFADEPRDALFDDAQQPLPPLSPNAVAPRVRLGVAGVFKEVAAVSGSGVCLGEGAV